MHSHVNNIWLYLQRGFQASIQRVNERRFNDRQYFEAVLQPLFRIRDGYLFAFWRRLVIQEPPLLMSARPEDQVIRFGAESSIMRRTVSPLNSYSITTTTNSFRPTTPDYIRGLNAGFNARADIGSSAAQTLADISTPTNVCPIQPEGSTILPQGIMGHSLTPSPAFLGSQQLSFGGAGWNPWAHVSLSWGTYPQTVADSASAGETAQSTNAKTPSVTGSYTAILPFGYQAFS
jgi:hypothetical protein